MSELRQDALGYPGMIGSAWTALAEGNAPRLWFDGAGPSMAPAALRWDANQRLRTRQAPPTVYYRIAFHRDGERLLPQISYIYFPGRAAPAPQRYLWRVTLGEDLQPLLFEAATPGQDATLVFPRREGAERLATSGDEPHVVLPPDTAPGATPLLQIVADAGTLIGVLDRERANPQAIRQYRLESLETLFQLELPGGGSRSALAALPAND